MITISICIIIHKGRGGGRGEEGRGEEGEEGGEREGGGGRGEIGRKGLTLGP